MDKAIIYDNSKAFVEIVNAEAHPQFMSHEVVYKISGEVPEGKVIGFAAVHNTVLGPALGGIRYKNYSSEADALGDVLRLSEAMTWKNSAVGLHHGGGKTSIMGLPGMDKPSDAVLEIIAEGLNHINSKSALYFGAQDMNLSEQAIDFLAAHSPWVLGRTSDNPDIVGGTPSPLTAMAVVECIKIAARYKLGRASMSGVRVSLQGLGTVGGEMARLLSAEGAVLSGCDLDARVFDALRAEGVAVQKVALEDIYDAPSDIFAPNALGGILTPSSIDRLEKAGVQIICGAANNQQADQVSGRESKILLSKNMLYCPDYIVNAGGVYWVAEEGKDARQTRTYIKTQVAAAFEKLLVMHADAPGTDMGALARQMAEQRIQEARKL